jgi:hypothetical protein
MTDAVIAGVNTKVMNDVVQSVFVGSTALSELLWRSEQEGHGVGERL